MQHKWFLFFSVLAAAKAASVFHGEIPVKVIYDEEVTHRLYVRNLDKTTQEEIQKLTPVQESIEQEKNEAVNLKALKNHEEKVQLSQEELLLATRRLPLDQEEKVEEKKLRIVTPPEVTVDENLENDNNLYEKIQEIINNGIETIKTDVKSSQEVVQPAIWNSFNEGVENFLQSVRNRNALRQNSNSSLPILDQFQNFASNFFGQFTGQNNNVPQDSQQPGFPQNIAGFFQNGISQIQSGISNVFSGQQSTSATILGDNPSTAAPTNPIQGFVQQAQSTLSNIFNPQQQNNQADQNTSPPNPIQTISNSIGQAFQNFNPFANRPAGEETSTQNNPFQAIQNALNNFNPFQQTTVKSSDASSTTANPIPSIPGIPSIPNVPSIPTIPPNLTNVGQQISENLQNPGAAIGSLVGGNNPLQGVGQQIGSAIPGNPLQSGNNPLQGVAQQIGSAIPGNPLQTGTNPIEGVAQQIGGAISGSPIPTGSNPIGSLAGQAGNLIPNNPGNNPLQGIIQQGGNLIPNNG
ncbi:uncharacterized protein [Onthophagus taurus]|uniref:uncharacterized protein n=1 Tax=Onthophagus taurus TaxID=166361 RepID=UPI0039BDDC38